MPTPQSSCGRHEEHLASQPEPPPPTIFAGTNKPFDVFLLHRFGSTYFLATDFCPVSGRRVIMVHTMKTFIASFLLLVLAIADRLVFRPGLNPPPDIDALLVDGEHLTGFFALIAAAGTAPPMVLRLLQVRARFWIGGIVLTLLVTSFACLLTRGAILVLVMNLAVIVIAAMVVLFFVGSPQATTPARARKMLVTVAVFASCGVSLYWEISRAGGQGYFNWGHLGSDGLGILAGWIAVQSWRARQAIAPDAA